MSEFLMNNEPTIRLGFFLGIFAVVALWEFVAPRRTPTFSRARRWPNNLGIVVLNAGLLKVVFPMTAVVLAMAGEAQGWGLLNAIAMPYLAKSLVAVLVLDLAIYLQHVMFHAVPALWRLHRMHHADLDFDVTTGARFHPIEILLSMGIKFMVVVALGAPAAAVLVFEVLLNGTAMFNHGNVRIP
ncbi:MAG: sterol desaturase family protein, partial [Alphaproteobacteria bacterium]|nr:sterol desaturase family protein [Alphaproteobacteria bacterium]